ncbi:MAG: tRNA pseudouridine(38-40) synthase TruA [Prosthecobacter sp.]|jgi:tRNA pseudouridine38-40 synthase|uniref:tRNA pseudouridine(38-40) synthase TruA n=1 Tax=Prosthecobacter sp. TaxID=1965333 RepID=UPI001A05C88F|nr:tRNA pseudouridine(38-40) synthase TruA [Prosthecobacter sp.]MBE2282813.1 tRNA pseudouridine(38-40) synthase TruA [Prosthecobacter sp.]
MSRSDVESKAGLRHGPAPGWKRLRLTIAYCGTPWKGWQSQDGGGGVQDEINATIKKATGIVTQVQGSGRTDAGVHALAQVAHGDVPDTVRMNGDAWVNALNACLPLTIRVLQVEDASTQFHARFDAAGKVYRYRIWRPRMLSPFEADRAWHVYGPLDMDALRWCCERLVGTHNFIRLSANRGDMPETERRMLPDKTTRTIHRAEVREEGDVLEFEFEGDGFLYKMVRLIVGSLIHVARKREPKEWFASLLNDPTGRQSNQTAPACGLYLVRVKYPAT